MMKYVLCLVPLLSCMDIIFCCVFFVCLGQINVWNIQSLWNTLYFIGKSNKTSVKEYWWTNYLPLQNLTWVSRKCYPPWCWCSLTPFYEDFLVCWILCLCAPLNVRSIHIYNISHGGWIPLLNTIWLIFCLHPCFPWDIPYNFLHFDTFLHVLHHIFSFCAPLVVRVVAYYFSRFQFNNRISSTCFKLLDHIYLLAHDVTVNIRIIGQVVYGLCLFFYFCCNHFLFYCYFSTLWVAFMP